jgi:two-component system nitrate/nitrite response regulator NarP
VLAHGGAAFVSKNEDPGYLLDTVAEVARGRMVFPYLDVSRINANPLSTLTKRELEILSSLAAGRTNKEIASRKGVSTNTVKYHIRNLFEKLGVSNRGQAIALYLKS